MEKSLTQQDNPPPTETQKNRIGSILGWNEKGEIVLKDLMSPGLPPSPPAQEETFEIPLVKNIDGSTYRQTHLFG